MSKKIVAVIDEHTCARCLELDGADPDLSGYPPFHEPDGDDPGCRCIVVETDEDVKPGQVWWDRNRCWCYGSDTANRICIIQGTCHHEKEEQRWVCLFFTWCSDGYMGTGDQRELRDKEIWEMVLVGNISSIKSFEESP